MGQDCVNKIIGLLLGYGRLRNRPPGVTAIGGLVYEWFIAWFEDRILDGVLANLGVRVIGIDSLRRCEV